MVLNAKPSQDFVPIKEVRDGIAVLKDNSMRGILLASSLNFALKSEDAQTAVISQFQNFLNSLDFSIQIFMESRHLDIRPYLALLEERYKAQTTELLKIQTREYIGFIKSFIEGTNIMTKTFFVVIPFTPPILQKTGSQSGLKGFLKKNRSETTESKMELFEENRSQLEQRMSVVEQGLIRSGVRVAKLGTEEIVELFYKLFNPGETEKPIKID
ncbi:MAG: hypothetical protein Q8P52_01965 [bacterium]|nr:hypothetical protein [bacterium]